MPGEKGRNDNKKGRNDTPLVIARSVSGCEA
jgi:hypothetical protein